MDRWLELDRTAALDFIKASKTFEQLGAEGGSGWDALELGESNFTGAFRALARRELEWTAEYLTSLKAEPARDLAVYEFLEIATQRDPARAKQFLDVFSAGVNRSAALRGYVRGLAATDARGALDLALREPTGPFRVALLESVIHFAEIGNVRELLDRVEDPTLRQELAYDALYAMSYRSRPDPLEWVKEETARLAGARGTNRDAAFWATAISQSTEASKIPEIVEWAATGNSDPHRQIFASFAESWAATDPAAAQRWLSENAVKLDPKYVESMDKFFTVLARADLAGVRQWVDSLPAGALQNQARFQIALGSGAKGDLAQVQAVYATLQPGDSDGKMAKQVAEILTKQDATTAAKWALQLPGGAARTTAIETVAAQWSQRDLQGVSAWLETIPEGPDRDASMKEYAAKVTFVDPRAGAASVEQITDSSLREKAASHVYWTWRNEDPASARAWVQGLSGMNETWRARLLKNSR
jgi:hypothetical protein